MAKPRALKFPRPATNPPGVAAVMEATAGERRNRELAECGRKIQALLTEYAASFAVQQTMTLDAESRPRYSYTVNIVGA